MLTYRSAIIAFVIGTATSLAAAPAMAQTNGPFTGPYVATVGGWDRMQANDAHKDGFLYGGQVGYDLGAGKVRLGPVLEVTGSTQKGCSSNDDTLSCAKAGRDIFVGGRVGYVASQNALVYLTAGYTNARYSGSVSTDGTTFSDDKDHSGGRIGAGIEYALTKNMFAKTEYRYSRYSNSIGRNQIIGGIGVRF